MSEKQVLVLPKNHGLNAADREALREAGIVVVTMKNPNEARMLSAERLPIDSNEMLRQVMKATAAYTGYGNEALKANAFMAICKAVEASNAAAGIK